MYSRIQFLLLILVLVLAGTVSIYQRHAIMGIPLIPGEQIDIWKIEAQIEFIGRGKAVTAKLTLPEDENFELVSEFTASSGYGVHLIRDEDGSRVVWSKRKVTGQQTLYYQASYKHSLSVNRDEAPLLSATDFEPWDELYQQAAQLLLDDAYKKSGNQEFLIRQLYRSLSSDNQNTALILSKFSRAQAMVHLMKMANVPARLVKGLILEDGRRHQQLVSLVKVYLNEQWQLMDVNDGELLMNKPILVWQEYRPSLLDLEGGRNSKASFSISHSSHSALQEATEATRGGDLLDFSIYHLPVAEQNLFKGILLLPMGTLVVVFLRIMIGLKCSGTFMPVLIATSFIQTTLVNGLIGFLAIVAAGLLIRSYLSNLNLLLVSRISAVVILVIGIIVMFTVVAFRLGLTEALTITYFPMIILAWTIERMSILWEEEGAKEVLIQGSGSLLVATLAYLLMDNELIRHWAFNFLGIHLIVMALVLTMGQYTGYRLLELRRFKPMADI